MLTSQATNKSQSENKPSSTAMINLLSKHYVISNPIPNTANTSLDDKIIDSITCPLSLQIFFDPIVLPTSGRTVERDFAKKLQSDPFSRKAFHYNQSIPTNYAIKAIVEEYLKKNPNKKNEQYQPLPLPQLPDHKQNIQPVRHNDAPDLVNPFHHCDNCDTSPIACIGNGLGCACMACMIGCMVTSPNCCNATIPFIQSAVAGAPNPYSAACCLQGLFLGTPGCALALAGAIRAGINGSCTTLPNQNALPPVAPVMGR